ncbi:uncharacterized protein LOC116841675 [Odontomachus brunneus]|uniref:uncharacterized protein LOC116841675 n=1 Tax=Odontomachus brunneus TaxID=486640 RepID=UPI0013F2A5A7|nr:uncharacterized protein LOC116841675 [Odontomachus brunneus]
MFTVKLRFSKKKTFRLDREFKKRLRRNLELGDLHFFWNAVKIKADPKIDVDFTKGMSALSIYGHDYRTPVSENVPESSLYIKPDIISKLNKLNISDKNEEDCNANIPQQDNEINITQGVSCLSISDVNLKTLYDKLENLDMSDNTNEEEQPRDYVDK